MFFIVFSTPSESQPKPENEKSIPSQNLPKLLVELTPSGWEIFDEVKQFTSDNLYEQIDGRAEFFISYDVIGLTFVSYVNRSNQQQFIDVSIYDMGNPTNAFGVFSGERSRGLPSLNLGRSSYLSDVNCFVWKGQYYIQIIASESSELLKKTALGLAERVTGGLPDSSERVWGFSVLPESDREPESVRYFRVNAMALDFMKNTFTAQYRKGNTLVTAFMSRQADMESARNAISKYIDFAKEFGKGIERWKKGAVDLIVCDMDDGYDVIFRKGRLVGGVLSVENRDLALRMGANLWQQIPME